MTKRTLGNAAAIYRVCQPVGTTHVADGDLRGMIAPLYRGFKLACLAGEVEAAKRKVDDYWQARYQAADDPAARVAVLMDARRGSSQESGQGNERT